MTDPNLVTPLAVSPRCSACKLPSELLTAFHRDRFEQGMTFEALALEYALPEHPLSESGVRRHFARHVDEPENSQISGADASGNGLEDAPTLGNTADDGLDSHALLEAGARTLAEIVRTLGREYQTAAQEHPQVAERAFGKFMKAHIALAKSVKQLEDGRVQRAEFQRTIPEIVRRLTTEAVRSILPVMRENAENVRQDVVEYAHGRLSAEDFSARLLRLELEWPKEVGLRMRAATTEALKAEEARVEG